VGSEMCIRDRREHGEGLIIYIQPYKRRNSSHF
jgi:hypothetical protein